MRISDWSSDVCSTDYIDLYQTHWPDPDAPYDAMMEALDELVCEGKVRILGRSEEHTSELQSLMRISYAVFCLKKKIIKIRKITHKNSTTPHTTHSKDTISMLALPPNTSNP